MLVRLSRPVRDIRPSYDVVVIGSGYGGAIAASRLARAGRRVCVLERGREFRPGEYPDEWNEVVAQTQVDTPQGRLGNATGLYDFRVNDGISVFQGCGLGGTSLVNANVALRADPRVFEDARWPERLRGDAAALELGYARAEKMLNVSSYPTGRKAPGKLLAHERSAKALGASAKFLRTPIAVTFADTTSAAGVAQKACNDCGDCVTGCNHGSKNTVLMNYLPDAVRHGAEVFTEARVARVERVDGLWNVHYQPLGIGREAFDAPELFVRAELVVLAAGTLGSTEILLRSREHGLALSDRLGRGFTGNGDVLGFAYNADEPIHGIGHGPRAPEGRTPVGPCITGVVDLRSGPELEAGMVIEEGSIPGAIAGLVKKVLPAAAAAFGQDTDSGFWDATREKAREWESAVRGPYHGALDHTQVYLVMAHDDGGGRMELVDDRLRIEWPGVGDQPVFSRVAGELRKATSALGGTFVPNPTWHPSLGRSVVTVHPLGGCGMAESAERGVVDDRCRVFAGRAGSAIHDGLYVCDGSIMPRSLGVNPFLTICALAERACVEMARDRGWRIDFESAGSAPAAASPAKRGLSFTETMRGHWSAGAADFEAGERAGKAAGVASGRLEFTLTVASDDLDAMLADEAHSAALFGTVTAPALDPEPLVASDGRFQLFVDDRDRAGERRMLYGLLLTSRAGRRFHFEGFKRVRDDGRLEAWADTTTLFVTIHDGPDRTAPVLGRGVLHIEPADLARQLTTMDIPGAADAADRLRGIAAFGGFFAGTVLDVYGGVFARRSAFDPDAPPRRRRELRLGAPELRPIRTEDGVELLLTRYRGGAKGPVLLSHGLGVSSRIFTIDTIETNLTEYLYANGYDVWLLDYRASIALPTADDPVTGDDIARHDYPAAVAAIRAATGAKAIDAVVHCFGSTTFFMAMLSGLAGIRSIVASQVAMHFDPGALTKVKTGMHVPEMLSHLGVDTLTAYVDTHADWRERLIDTALRVYPIEPGESCNSKVCHRITFLYGHLYEHDRLDAGTHAALHEMFGVGSMKGFEHLARLCREGRLVDARGRDAYLPHLERLALPITIVHGAENACFLPSSTERSFEALREANGSRFYERHVIRGYGHIDCIFGREAVRDVYGIVLAHLQRVGEGS